VPSARKDVVVTGSAIAKTQFKVIEPGFVNSMNVSSETRHAKAADGKYPQRFPSENLDEPSALNVPLRRYLPKNHS
jgi:hypothetical protein